MEETHQQLNVPAGVTDHAVLRWLERVCGIDVEEARRRVLPPEVATQVRCLGDGIYPVGDSHRVRVRGNAVVTVFSYHRRKSTA